MSIGLVYFAREVVLRHYLATDEAFQWKCREHIQPKAQSCDVDHEIVCWEVVEDVALSLVAEDEVAAQCHDDAGNHGDTGGVVCDFGETIHGRCSQRAVDEKAVVVAYEGEGDDADGLEEAVVDEEATFELSSHGGGEKWTLGYDGDYDYEHADQC